MDALMKVEETTNGGVNKEENHNGKGSNSDDKNNDDKINIMENPLTLPLISNIGTPASVSALGSLMAMTAMSSNSMMSMMGLQVGGDDQGPKLDPEDIEVYKQAFDDFDRNKDGTIAIGVYSN